MRTDPNPQLKQGVVGAFAISRTLALLKPGPECTAIPLQCGPPIGKSFALLFLLCFIRSPVALSFVRHFPFSPRTQPPPSTPPLQSSLTSPPSPIQHNFAPPPSLNPSSSSRPPPRGTILPDRLPEGYLNYDMIKQLSGAGLISAVAFGASAVAIEFAFSKGYLRRFPGGGPAQ